jgi:uncharacterized protein (TIRG00374 family)
MPGKLSVRGWLTILTIVLLVVVIFFTRHEVYKAWLLLDKLNLWILALIIPVQLFSYYCTGGMIFSYLRSKGNLKDMSHAKMTRTALELNFVNHILPSGGAAGFSYLSWVLARHGVSAGRSTTAQIVRFALTFISFVLIMIVAIIFLVVDHHISRLIIILCGLLVVLCVGGTLLVVYVLGNSKRSGRFANWVTRTGNRIVSFVTRGRKPEVLKSETIKTFFRQIHQDLQAIRADKRILRRPFIWAILANVSDVALIWIAFWSLGTLVNPAVLFVAFGVSSIASVISVAPGGAGVYEAIMITFLASSNVPADVAIAGTLIARVTLVLGTILFGYIFYQLTVIKYGKATPQRQ